MAEQYDYIVVGAGSAGCVMAERLSADPRHRVLLLEAGGSDRRFWIKLPMGYGKTFYDQRVNWKYQADPDPGLNGRSIYFPRGKVLGGSSSVNAMVYCRGLPSDYEDWAALGNPLWSWSQVKPWFEQIENPVDEHGRAQHPQGDAHRLFVSDVRHQLHPLERPYFEAAQQAGLPFTDDFNAEQPEGVGRYRINTRRGLRWSAADAYLRPALRRSNFKLQTRALVRQVQFDGRRATGIHWQQGSTLHHAQARRAVVLCAGAINSPQLLQLSGVGAGSLLQQHGIAVRLDQPRVGAGLQDHLAMSYTYEATQPTLNNELASLAGRMRMAMQFVLGRGGPLSISVNQCGGFVRSGADAPHADLQLYCNPISYTLAASEQGSRIEPDRFPGFILCFQPCRPLSHGRVDIQSDDPTQAPRIRPNYLTDPLDLDLALRGAKLIKRLEETPAMRSLIRRPLGAVLQNMDEAAMLEDFRQRASTCYHPVGTCAMGPSPDTSVVDQCLQVHGLQGLFVVDASVFPTLTSGNTHAPTTMVAHRGAGFVLAATG